MALGSIPQKVIPDPSRLVYWRKLLASGGGVFDIGCDEIAPARKYPCELYAVHQVLSAVGGGPFVGSPLPCKITSEPTYRTRHPVALGVPFGLVAPMPPYTGVTKIHAWLSPLRMPSRTPNLSLKP